LDAAADLFARKGVAFITLRDIATQANVQLSLISRYIGSREQLVRAVFDDLSEQIGDDVIARPLEQVSFERDSAMGRWTRLIGHLALKGDDLTSSQVANPARGLAQVIKDAYGLDDEAARLRGAQIVASALGWRIFEDYLVAAAGLEDIPRQALRDELTAAHRRLGATPWPSPPDPPARQAKRPRKRG
jgi:AcrR family transcriptional regulator